VRCGIFNPVTIDVTELFQTYIFKVPNARLQLTPKIATYLVTECGGTLKLKFFLYTEDTDWKRLKTKCCGEYFDMRQPSDREVEKSTSTWKVKVRLIFLQ
jgi:hypothetical protein